MKGLLTWIWMKQRIVVACPSFDYFYQIFKMFWNFYCFCSNLSSFWFLDFNFSSFFCWIHALLPDLNQIEVAWIYFWLLFWNLNLNALIQVEGIEFLSIVSGWFRFVLIWSLNMNWSCMIQFWFLALLQVETEHLVSGFLFVLNS